MEDLQIRSHGLTSQSNLNTPAAFYSVKNREIYLRKIKKTLSLQHYYFNKENKKAIKSAVNKEKRSLYFKYQCLFWSVFGTAQVEGSMNYFYQNSKIFTRGVFFKKHVECPHFFSENQQNSYW